MALGPILPGLAQGAIRRWIYAGSWSPAESVPLCRHRRAGGEERVLSNSRVPPPGYEIEFDLGSIQLFPKPGTRPLVEDVDGSLRLAEAGEVHESFGVAPADPFDPDRHNAELRVLGHLEQVPFPMFLALEVAVDPVTGGAVLVSGSEDPLSDRVVDRRTLGFIEPYPIEPRHPPACDYTLGLAGLLLGVDQRRRRHEYAVGAPPEGELVGELGSVLTDDRPGLVRLRREPGGLVTSDGYVAVPGRPPLRIAARWTLAPLAWRGRWGPLPRLRAAVRRGLETVRGFLGPRRASAGPAEEGAELGFLLPAGGDGRIPLYSSFHPVNGDQLLTRNPHTAAAMGYGQPVLLGYLRAVAPVTGELGMRGVAVPWASRFGDGRGAD